MPWLLNEDAALKLKLQGLYVTDANSGPNGRNVPVRFRLPETEVADLTFPIIVIQHDQWAPAPERMHDGLIQLPYVPEGQTPWFADTGPATTTFQPTDSPYYSWFPTPYNLDYIITVYTRFMHEHMIPIVSALAQESRLHANRGFLDIPQDGTKRTMQLLGGGTPQNAKDEKGKRMFMTVYKVRVFSEIIPALYQYTRANYVHLNLSVYTSDINLSVSQVQEAKSLLSVGPTSAWNVQPQLPE